ncbi:hypothetical protein AC578_2806 [Pseudocercospora eumusae]|uniref:Uncharacterized protein n=1 Tax=Pseudocercospora eumusae TaxID=321146 RepID=A0A139HH50_9PEZI|nr:hypothetical protein AC578_2806 [Pseudocercospora eumusae]
MRRKGYGRDGPLFLHCHQLTRSAPDNPINRDRDRDRDRDRAPLPTTYRNAPLSVIATSAASRLVPPQHLQEHRPPSPRKLQYPFSPPPQPQSRDNLKPTITGWLKSATTHIPHFCRNYPTNDPYTVRHSSTALA